MKVHVMDTDLNFDVWLSTYTQAKPAVIVPFIRSTESQALEYLIEATNQGRSGTSRTAQSGSVHLAANETQALAQLVLTRTDSEHCSITIAIKNSKGHHKTFTFKCENNGPTQG
ncbi:MAG TPA: hypothetical protein DEB15_13735 [Pusillimonas sp.]|jgi:hypothetical protein|nr:hypothetical protein [Pusillimonas sp.]|tara:strand:- start:126266 stop:126607 length:342 start_codon:yes stop_codon:yes gene_type:complete